MSPQIIDNALGAVGNTPLVRLDKVAVQFGLNRREGGEAHRWPSVVIEPTSGNTGIGMAMACAIKGYRCIITLPNKMSLEKEAALRALGAEVVRTPTEAAWDSPESHIGVAKKLQSRIPGGIILDQYRNVNNPSSTAVVSTPSTPARPSSGKVDVVIAGAGTGGTVTGVSRAMKKTHNKECIVVGVDPKGSILAVPEQLNAADNGAMYVVEGIGYDFIPDVLSRDPADVDSWIKTGDDESFAAVRVLMRTEGLLVGGSSGSALSGAEKWFKTEAGQKVAQTEGKNVVVIFADGIRNYMSKPWFLSMALEAEPSELAASIADVMKE
ncbi:tryptophan synthase beta subunit-like PLP-dependent enzyme [Mycena latifolia]|nr:tryptophan synthase beta subunit-like PLP-dependent enzyme [Mycena latifolia]